MSQQNKYELELGQNKMTKLEHVSLEEVEYEYNLCYETLNGVYVDGELVIEGLLHTKNYQGNPDMLEEAIRVWKRRLDNASNELIARQLLS